MKSNIVNLAHYRQRTRKAYLAKHGVKLTRFVERFIKTHVEVGFQSLAEDFRAAADDGFSWDYVEFRELLAEAFDAAFGKLLYQELSAQPWFDGRLITQEEVVERCLSSYILEGCGAAVLP